jgi:hypothetical protein
MENQQLTAQTAKKLRGGIAGKTGTVGANWHQIDAKTFQPDWAGLGGLKRGGISPTYPLLLGIAVAASSGSVRP